MKAAQLIHEAQMRQALDTKFKPATNLLRYITLRVLNESENRSAVERR